jgi:hypothetical protein
MGRKYVPLIICCLLFIIAGCNGKKAGQSMTSPTVQSQQATPGMTVANPTTKLPQPATTGQTETNPAPTKASDTERQLNQQIAGVLYSQVKIPVMMPSYWPSSLLAVRIPTAGSSTSSGRTATASPSPPSRSSFRSTAPNSICLPIIPKPTSGGTLGASGKALWAPPLRTLLSCRNRKTDSPS